MSILFWSEASFWGTASGGEGGTHGNSEDYKTDSYPTVNDNGEREAFEQSCLDNVRDMIRVNRNHPSIIIWSMGNEVFFGENHDLKKALISKMAGYAKQLDPTRATAMGGTQRGDYDKLENVDVAGYNGDGAKIEEFQNPGIANMVSEYASHTGSRPDSYRAYYGDVATENGEPVQYAWRSGISLWCAFHHGSIAARSYGDMGFIDYYRLPLRTWYYHRWKNTGEEPEQSSEGTAAKLALEASDLVISNDGTQDSHIIVTVQDQNGTWVNTTPKVTLEIVDGPGIFPTGKTMVFEPGNSMRDGKAAIEFRSYYAGETTIQAAAEGLEPAFIKIITTGSASEEEPAINTMYGTFMSDGGYVASPIKEPELYRFVDYSGSPLTASSGSESRLNILDGDAKTEWRADVPGSGQWLYVELEHGGINLYKARLTFNGKVYPYKIQYKEMNIDEDEWRTLAEYDKTTVLTRPEEESFYGTYMRYFRIEFTDVPENEYANLADIKLYGIRSDTDGYETGYKYLSDLEWKSAESAGKGVKKDTSVNGKKISTGGKVYRKGLGVMADSEIVYSLNEVTDGFARFQCTVGIDEEVNGNPDVTVQVYGDSQLMYEKKLTDKKDTVNIDVSISKVKELKLMAISDKININNHVDWADAKLIGALRDISVKGKELTVQYFSNMETLVPGTDYEITADFLNSKEENQELTVSLALYNKDGTLISSKMENVDVNGKETLDMSVEVPEDIPVGSYVKFVAWDRNSLIPMTDIITVSRVMGDPEKGKYPEITDTDDWDEEDGHWVNILGDDVNKSEGWGRWTPANGSISGYETYVDGSSSTNWNGSWIEQEFTGSQVKVFAKMDRSQHGAKIYIDGTLIEEISTNSSEGDIYIEVFDSGKMEMREHIIRIEPTGKFGLDCIQYYEEDILQEPPAPEQGYEKEIKVYGKDESIVKNGSWNYWHPSEETSVIPEAGYETYIDSWENSSVQVTFVGVQVSLCAKLDGSKSGADIYIDGKQVDSVDTKKSPDSYKEVFQSGLLPFGEHTMEVKPVGKFGFDYISFYTGKPEDRTELLAAVEEYGKLNSEDYAAGWDDFQAALKIADRISKKPGYTQNDIDKALKNLNYAKNALVYFVERDESRLKEAIKEGLQFIYEEQAEKCDIKLAAEFTEILFNASANLNNRGLKQEKLDETAQKVEDFKQKLELSKIPDKPTVPDEPVMPEQSEKPGGETAVNSQNEIKKGYIFNDGKLIYRVINEGKKTVYVTGTVKKSVKKVKIPAVIKIQGNVYKVTGIGKSAFYKCSRLEKVTIGKNVCSIKEKAFYKNKKLKKVIIKSKVLKSVGKNSFKETAKKISVKVPDKKLKIYKKRFKKAGLGKGAKIK